MLLRRLGGGVGAFATEAGMVIVDAVAPVSYADEDSSPAWGAT